MKWRRRSLIVAMVSLSGVLVWSEELAEINSPLFQSLEWRFLCVDGCGMALENCSNTTAQQMRSDLLGMIRDDYTESEILGRMVAIYGPEVLREPPREGFNLLVWVLPFAAVVVGGVFIFMVVNKWIFVRHVASTAGEELYRAPDDAILDRLVDEERKRLL